MILESFFSSNWWHEKFNQQLTLSEITILSGWHQKSNNWEVLNYRLIIAKYHFFCYKCTRRHWNFDRFLLRLNNKIYILPTTSAKTLKPPRTIKNKRGPNYFSQWEI